MTAIDAGVQAKLLGAEEVTMVYRRGKAREWLTSAAFARLKAADRAAWTPVTIDEGTYQGLSYGSPLAYLLPLERLGQAGFGGLRGKRAADFGHGGIGQLRLFAELGAEVVGIDVDPLQPVLYAAPGDQGRLGKAGGSVKLVPGRFPADPRVVAAVGAPAAYCVSRRIRGGEDGGCTSSSRR